MGAKTGGEMKLDELINKIEESRKSSLTKDELRLIKKLWNTCVDCIADEWPVLGDSIRNLKAP